MIFGISGQDGSYLADHLLNIGYEVHGVRRRVSSYNTSRIDHLIENKQSYGQRFFLHYGDVTDFGSVLRTMSNVKPHEIYNLAAQSHVGVSFDQPELTSQINALGTLKILENIKLLNLDTKFYQASTSELYGNALTSSKRVDERLGIDESFSFNPVSPYGVSKLFAYQLTEMYKSSYGIWACNGILFNHESPRRGEIFVSRKISLGVASIALGLQDYLELGNLDAQRDWGHASDYVIAMHLMLQQVNPENFIISTGECFSVRHFVSLAFESLGIEVEWEKQGPSAEDEVGINRKTGKLLVKVNPRFFRVNEIDKLKGNPSRAKSHLGWNPKIDINSLVFEMCAADYHRLKSRQGA